MTDETQNNAPNQKSSSRKGVATSLVALALIVLVVVMAQRSNSRPVPEIGEIQSMEATYYHAEKDGKETFQVSAAHWPAIISSLLPATVDGSPAKWVSLGELKIKLTHGDSFIVSLYDLDQDPGAFSSGPTWEQRTYYRGGSTSKLKSALNQASKASGTASHSTP